MNTAEIVGITVGVITILGAIMKFFQFLFRKLGIVDNLVERADKHEEKLNKQDEQINNVEAKITDLEKNITSTMHELEKNLTSSINSSQQEILKEMADFYKDNKK